MLNRIFAARNPSDLLRELLKPTFNEEKINTIYKTGIDINWQNETKEGFIHLCAQKNLAQSMLWLIQNGADIELEGKDAQTALFYAVESKSKEAILVLMRNKVNANHVNIHKRTALQEAVIAGTKFVADILMEHTQNLDNVDEHGRNLIFDAVSNGDKYLITKVAKNKDININQIDNGGNTILHNKAALKNSEIAIELMDEGADPTLRDSNGKNFLFYAAAKGIESENIIEKAIDLGCNINSKSNDNQSILMETLLAFKDLPKDNLDKRESLLSMVKKLLDEGVDINAQDNRHETALFIAVRNLEMDCIEFLLEQINTDVNHQNIDGETVLDLVTQDGIINMQYVLFILDFGVNPNLKDWNGKSIVEKLIEVELHYSNKKEIERSLLKKFNKDGQHHVLLKEILVRSNVNLSNLNSRGKPLFFDTVLYRNDNLFNLLRKHGLDLNQKDMEERNILHTLLKEDTKTLGFNSKALRYALKSLILLGVDINSTNKLGDTVTHQAILEHSDQTVKMLLNLKADTTAVDNKGRSLVHNCVWAGKLEHLKVLHSSDENTLNIVDHFGILPINYAAFMGYVDLVIEMIKEGSHVNNTNEKDCKMVTYLRQFSYNLNSLCVNIVDDLERKNVDILVENMQKEFLASDICEDYVVDENEKELFNLKEHNEDTKKTDDDTKE